MRYIYISFITSFESVPIEFNEFVFLSYYFLIVFERTTANHQSYFHHVSMVDDLFTLEVQRPR